VSTWYEEGGRGGGGGLRDQRLDRLDLRRATRRVSRARAATAAPAVSNERRRACTPRARPSRPERSGKWAPPVGVERGAGRGGARACPLAAAWCRALQPLSFLRPGRAPAAASTSTAARFPCAAASASGASPARSAASTSAPLQQRSSTTCPGAAWPLSRGRYRTRRGARRPAAASAQARSTFQAP
jgi:hypothetical protein